jgi:hypothetical protein
MFRRVTCLRRASAAFGFLIGRRAISRRRGIAVFSAVKFLAARGCLGATGAGATMSSGAIAIVIAGSRATFPGIGNFNRTFVRFVRPASRFAETESGSKIIERS